MKCAVLMSDKMANIPLFECGGIFLHPGEKLLVKKEWADEIVKRYKPKIVLCDVLEKRHLANGHYEIVPKEKKKYDADVKEEALAPDLDESPSNRSMQHNKKVKHK